jgi:thiamine biosynthesis lipoprotein ApbE
MQLVQQRTVVTSGSDTRQLQNNSKNVILETKTGHAARTGEINAYKISIGKPEGKRPRR